MMSTSFVVTARKGIQYTTEHATAALLSGALMRLMDSGYEVENIEREDRQAANVRFDVDGRPVQYADADDASEHHIRIVEAGGWEPTLHDNPFDDPNYGMYDGEPDDE
jgi:hypothetical protein